MDHPKQLILFPAGFPSELAQAAFVSRDEAAWPPTIAVIAVEWFAAHSYAVLGTEIWLLRGEAIQSLPIGSSGAREVHGNTVDRRRDEAWGCFIARAASETRDYLLSFKVADILEHGRVYFNVVWVNEREFAALKTHS